MSTHTTPSKKVALVTGASRGIGAAIAQRLAEDGFAVIVNYASSPAAADALVAQLTQRGLQAAAVQADVSNADEVRRLFDSAERIFGSVDVLVNNAGRLQVLPLAETSDELFEQTFALNVRGTFNTLREAAQRMRNGGRIINLSSSVLAMNLPGYAIYSGTKAAVEAIGRVFAKELRGREIAVNAVAPGPIATELFLNGKSDEQIAHFASMPPLERLARIFHEVGRRLRAEARCYWCSSQTTTGIADAKLYR